MVFDLRGKASDQATPPGKTPNCIDPPPFDQVARLDLRVRFPLQKSSSVVAQGGEFAGKVGDSRFHPNRNIDWRSKHLENPGHPHGNRDTERFRLLQTTTDRFETKMTVDPLLAPHQSSIEALQRAGNQFWTRGWSLGTSSNYSVVIDRDPLRILVTASGKDKGHLGLNDFVIVDEAGKPSPAEQPKSSAETLLHCSIAKHRGAGSILHTHSVWGTILSNHFFPNHGIRIEGFEFLKGLEGIGTHQTSIWVPIFENTQDIPALQAEVEAYWNAHPDQACYGYLIRRHGMYTWGKDVAAAVRHIEVLEFLLECLGRQMSLP